MGQRTAGPTRLSSPGHQSPLSPDLSATPAFSYRAAPPAALPRSPPRPPRPRPAPTPYRNLIRCIPSQHHQQHQQHSNTPAVPIMPSGVHPYRYHPRQPAERLALRSTSRHDVSAAHSREGPPRPLGHAPAAVDVQCVRPYLSRTRSLGRGWAGKGRSCQILFFTCPSTGRSSKSVCVALMPHLPPRRAERRRCARYRIALRLPSVTRSVKALPPGNGNARMPGRAWACPGNPAWPAVPPAQSGGGSARLRDRRTGLPGHAAARRATCPPLGGPRTR